MKSHNYILFLIVTCLLFFQSVAQEMNPIVEYSPKDYNGDNQIWSFSQTQDSFIYAANNQGLLEFNGSEWSLYPVPNNSIVRSVFVTDNKIFTGCFMDFGYWIKDDFGELKYKSLAQLFNFKLLEDEEFWNITELNGWMIFQSLSRIYLLNLETNESKIIKSEVEISKMIKFEETIYFQKTGIGLFKIEMGEVALFNNNDIIKNNRIIEIFRLNKKIIALTNNAGLFEIDENNKSIPWNIDPQVNIDDITVYSAKKLVDNSILVGTISNGVIHIDSEGKLIKKYNQNNGLSNNTILCMFEDNVKNVWLGLDYGINYLEQNSQFKVYENKLGMLGTIYNAIIYQDLLYLGTNQGLFFKERGGNSEFKVVKGTQGQVWVLKEIDDQLFCGHDSGTFIIDQGKIVTAITETKGSWDFKQIQKDEKLILQGNYEGLNILENINGKWVYRNAVDGFELSSRFFEIHNNQIFVNHEFKGLYELNYQDNFNQVQSLNINNYIDKGIGASLLKFSDELIYSSSNGIYKFNESKKFVKDTSFTSIFSQYKTISTLLPINGETDKLWRFADDNILIISPSSLSKVPNVEVIPIASDLRNVVAGFENLSKITSSEYLIGTSNGYIIYNKEVPTQVNECYININNIEVYEIDKPRFSLNQFTDHKLENKTNNIEFKYSVPYYGDITNIKYQYQLKGQSDNWSEWSSSSTHLFENLPFGNYTFNVKGKVGNTVSNNIESVQFQIARPWYLSNLAIVSYLIIIVLLILTIHSFYEAYYVKKQNQLLEETQRKIELNELENNQKIVEIKNEKLKLDIENKNRELAISTMSLIKKNEFLNTVKNELKKTNLSKSNSIIELIDNNINNTDDWQFFEKAFNNADKDFLKKVKSIHPELTPNDLKLCAYLRLNLSSKEIAPLLNISSRSVEVKRYRLRKKMNLPHESSLTNYILEI